MKKHLNKILALAFSGVSIFATACGKNIDKSVAESPDVMACRVINSIVSQDEDEYIEIHPDSISSPHDNYDYLMAEYGLRCQRYGIDCDKDYTYKDLSLCITSDEDTTSGRIHYKAFLDETMIFNLSVYYDIQKEGYVVDRMQATLSSEERMTKSQSEEHGYKMIDTSQIEIY
ncbi:MAG: hypothetical protein IJA12_05550 [Oscillospiraceae bacterium]|nr:hypothetical protein [Oscillospiraceae bacterium]